jgi:hypothetical protein
MKAGPCWGALSSIVVIAMAAACSEPATELESSPVPPLSRVEGVRPAFRRLTHQEYRRTLRDLFPAVDLGVDALTAELPSEENFEGFSNDSRSLAVSPTHVEQYLGVAEKVAERVTANLVGLMACDPSGAAETDCVRGFVGAFGKRAYRRPLLEQETASLVALYASAKQGADVATGVRTLLAAMLTSPSFLYRYELGAKGSSQLTEYEIASRLSYLLIGSLPDEPLFGGADRGELGAKGTRLEQATRLLSLPRAREASLTFYDEWLSLRAAEGADRDGQLFPELTPEVRTAMREETRAFIEDVLWQNDGRLETLLLAPYSVIPPALAPIYGFPIAAGPKAARVNLDPKTRGGLLTQPSILAAQAGTQQSSPTLRGLFVRMRFLCESVPPVPDGVSQDVPGPNTASTTRQRYDQHQKNPACAGCHERMDPIGYGLENFDAIGRYREKEGAFPVDSSGTISGSSDAAGNFKGFQELAKKLAASQAVSACVSQKLFQFAFARAPDDADAPTIQGATQRFVASDKNLRELLLAFVESDSFTHR